VFRLETARTLGRDWVVPHDSRLLQLERRGPDCALIGLDLLWLPS